MNKSIDTTPVAIVGLGCLLPGASGVAELWDLVNTGRSGIVRVPDEQFDRKNNYDERRGIVGRSYSDLAGLVDYSVIDKGRIASAFPFISADEINQFDQAHIAYASTVVDALESARIRPMDIADQSAGVYVGHATPSGLSADYNYGVLVPEAAELLREVEILRQSGVDADDLIASLINSVRSRMPHRSASNNPELSSSAAAKFISRAYHLHGPAIVFNSSCASSLQAFAHAVKSIRRGEIDTAIVGGASCFHVNTLILFSLAHSLSAGGSAPFTEAADGLVVGEGYVTLILKRLSHALRDGNPILALVRGIGISSDGKGKSLWAPRKEGQIESIQRAYSDPSILEGLQYIECHATSTHLGDATEMESLAAVLQGTNLARFKIPHSLPIGSIKRNIGHTLENSGLAGLAKILVQMEHELIPAAVAPDCELNKSVNWDSIPMFPSDKEIIWERGHTLQRRAAVSSFGIGGHNVHVVVEDYIAEKVFTYVDRQCYLDSSSDDINGNLIDVTNDKTAIAIIGAGTILPGVKSCEEFQAKINSGGNIRIPIPKERWNKSHYCNDNSGSNSDWQIPFLDAAIIDDYNYDWKRHKVPPKQLAQANPLQFMFLDAVDQALQSAGYINAVGEELKSIPRERTGCIVGTFFGGDFASQLDIDLRVSDMTAFFESYLSGKKIAPDIIAQLAKEFTQKIYSRFPAIIDETGSFTASSLASRITKSYNLMGGGVAIDADECSTGAAINCCLDMLLDNSADMMFCLCGERNITPERILDHAIAGELESLTDKLTPLGHDRTGIVPGEGCVVFILKRLADAKRDQDRILGILHGSATAMKASTAIKNARRLVNAQDVAAVEIVYNGTLESETSSVSQVGRYYPNCPIDTRVDQFGYMPTTSGAVALLTAIESLKQKSLPAPSNALVNESQQESQRKNATPLISKSIDQRLGMAVHIVGRNHSIQHLIIQRHNSINKQNTEIIPQEKITKTEIKTNIKTEPNTKQETKIDNDFNKNKEINMNTKTDQDTKQILFKELTDMNQFTHFDATARRRERLRKEAAARSENLKNINNKIAPTIIIKTEKLTDAKINIDNKQINATENLANAKPESDNFKPKVETIKSETVKSETEKIEAVNSPIKTEPKIDNTQTTNSKFSADEIESFLINFVVDQTGYPQDVVDLDVDLESDLGIDSIKKAQLFGEIGQYFDIKPASEDGGNLTLDQFATLRSVKDFLTASLSLKVVDGQKDEQKDNKPKPSDEPKITPPSTEPSAELSAKRSAEPSAKTSAEITPTIEPLAREEKVKEEKVKFDESEIESFLINFVIDQTGYPPEVVDLDVDLESDLGIDSIKKAQLFGEIGQYFDIKPASEDGSNLTLDQFATLRSVKDFLTASLSLKVVDGQKDVQKDNKPKPSDEPKITPPPTESPAEPSVKPSAELSTKTSVEITPTIEPSAREEKVKLDESEVETFLINFVIDQTGYPPEVVDLDVDLESDLGIDSIKKAQLFGEIGQYFDIKPAAKDGSNLTLDQFPTLRSVKDFILQN
ncbi:MAG: phosphopantetheine-binding protein [Planctomycetaceae bacterium]|jgi:3-oxoacyl-(acyl-carrier-protein) synthase/acyl carrier protein|nr:phosphopantetheine-binding protein [Planctomycetaceae bacterium]